MDKMSSTNANRKGRRIPPLSPPPKEGSNDHDITRIDEIIRNARTTWFLLLGVLVFAGITLLGVQDVDFFAAQRETKLPLVGVSVPVEYFFWAGAALVTALYVYFHLYLELLWAALGRARARIDGDPLSERIAPWLVVEWALRYRDHLTAHRERRQRRLAASQDRDQNFSLRAVPDAIGDWFYAGEPAERSSVPRAMGWVGTLMSLSLVWLFGLLVLFYFWWRSMPAHIDWMSLWLGFLFTFALWMAWRSWRAARRMLDRRGWSWTQDRFDKRLKMGIRTFTAFALLMLAMSSVTLVRTASDWWPGEHAEWNNYGEGKEAADWRKLYGQDDEHSAYWNKRWSDATSPTDKWHYFGDRAYTNWISDFITRADLAEAQLVALPKDWLSRDEAEKEFRAVWAEREGLHYRDPFPVVPARDVEAEFLDAQSQAQSKFANAGVQGTAPAFDAERFRKLWAVDQGLEALSPFPIQSARSPENKFEKVWEARRKTWLDTQAKPSLEERNLRRAHLQSAFLPGVKLAGARLEGADLSGATLEGSILVFARLEGTDLSFARLEGTVLSDARLEGAVLAGARLEGAVLAGAGLDGADLTRARLWGAQLAKASLERADLTLATLDGANLTQANLKRAVLPFARLDGANLTKADLERAVMKGASLEDANLTRANLEGVDLRGASLERANLASASLDRSDLRAARLKDADLWGASFKHADLRFANLEGADLRGASLESGNLRRAWLGGADLTRARLFGKGEAELALSKTASLRAANFADAALRVADMSGIDVTELKDLGISFGDGSVKIAEKDRPPRWCKKVLTDKEFFGRWRGYVEPDGRTERNDQFEGHPPIPPSDC